MLTDEEMIEVLAKRADEECGFSKLSAVLNHYSWVDVFTYLFLERDLRAALIDAYKGEIASAMVLKDVKACKEAGMDYQEWKADVATRGGC
jgi:hypothetical protein